MFDPVQPPAALPPVQHAELAPALLTAALLRLMHCDALRQEDDARAALAKPVREIDLLMIEEEALVEAPELREHAGADEHRRTDHKVDVALARIVEIAQRVAVRLRAEHRPFAPSGAAQERLPPGVELTARRRHFALFVEQLDAGHGDVGMRGEVV